MTYLYASFFFSCKALTLTPLKTIAQAALVEDVSNYIIFVLCSFYNIHRYNYRDENYCHSIKLTVNTQSIPTSQIKR